MNNINVKDVLGTVEKVKANKPSVFNYSKWNAKTAFNRLQISREIMKQLAQGINDNVEGLPVETRKTYDLIMELLEKVQEEEIRTIKFGE